MQEQFSLSQGDTISGNLPPPEQAYLKEVSVRLLEAQAAQRQVFPSDLPEAEAAAGKSYDSRVDLAQSLTFSAISRDAQIKFLSRWEKRSCGLLPSVPLLLAPTSRVVDHVVDGSAVLLLVDRLIREGKESELRDALDKGPPTGKLAWNPPSAPVQLVAGMLRWSFVRDSDKERMRVSQELRQWVKETLEEASHPVHQRLGGISAVGSLLCSVLKHQPTMLALGSVPEEVPELLPADLRVVHEDPSLRTLSQLPLATNEPGHFSFSDRGAHVLLSPSMGSVKIAGVVRDALETRKIDILLTGSTAVPGFGEISPDRLRALGTENSAVVLSGFQRISSLEEVDSFVASVALLHQAGARLGLCYSDTKVPTLEPLTLARLREIEAISFLGMNSFETVRVLERIAHSAHEKNPLRVSPEQTRRIDRALQIAHAPRPEWEDGHESPEWLYHSAALLQEVLKIPLIRVRGKISDAIVMDKTVTLDPALIRDAMIVSRNLGTIKVASSSGLIDSAEGLAFLSNPPKGEYLAALHKMSDEIARQNNSGAGTSLPHSCYTALPDGRTFLAIPPVEMYDRRGGTQSAGDVMDCVFISEVLPLLGAR